MNLSIRLVLSFVALVAFSAHAADITGEWSATIVTAKGRRAVLDYTGELVSDTEVRFKREAAGTANPAVQFAATRVAGP